VSAIFSLFNNVIGLVVGATSLALPTDYFFHDRARLHHSLAIIAAIVLPLSTFLAWWGLPHLGRSIAAAQLWIGRIAPEIRRAQHAAAISDDLSRHGDANSYLRCLRRIHFS
jgi:hypothetical protein